MCLQLTSCIELFDLCCPSHADLNSTWDTCNARNAQWNPDTGATAIVFLILIPVVVALSLCLMRRHAFAAHVREQRGIESAPFLAKWRKEASKGLQEATRQCKGCTSFSESSKPEDPRVGKGVSVLFQRVSSISDSNAVPSASLTGPALNRAWMHTDMLLPASKFPWYSLSLSGRRAQKLVTGPACIGTRLYTNGWYHKHPS